MIEQMMIHESFSSNLIQQDGKLPLIEEDIILSLIADVRTEVFSNTAVSIRSILLIKLLLDMLRHKVFCLKVIDCIFSLCDKYCTSFIASAIISDPSGISMMFYFLITSVIFVT